MPILTLATAPLPKSIAPRIATKATQKTKPVAVAVKLRSYQVEIVNKIYAAIRDGSKSPLLIATGGLGKTTVAAWIMRDRSVKSKDPKRSIFLVERNCLLKNSTDTLTRLGVDCSIVQGQRKIDWEHPCFVASLQTIRSWLAAGKDVRALLGDVGLFVLDEAHDGVGQDSYQQLLTLYPDTLFLGLTASPWRMKRAEWLGRWFDSVVESLQPPEAIAKGWLCPSRNFNVKGVLDLADLDARTGGDEDFNEADMAQQAMRPEALAAVVEQWQLLGEGKPTLVFCSTVAQAKAQAEAFAWAGITADWQNGSTSDAVRAAQDAGLRSGDLTVLCSVNTLTKGYDNPCIGCVVFARATKSKSGFFQAAWRGCRPNAGKDYFIVLDFGGNLIRLGDPMGFQDYSIDEPPPLQKIDGSGKECPACEKKVPIYTKQCSCGWVFGSDKEGDQIEIFDPSLYELKEWFDPVGRERIQFLRSTKKRNYQAGKHPNQATTDFREKFGFVPPREWHRGAIFGPRCTDKSREAYSDYLQRFSQPYSWVKGHLSMEFGA